MKASLTELVFILDRSGSIGGLKSDTIKTPLKPSTRFTLKSPGLNKIKL